MNREDLAWAAGVHDGEGWTGLLNGGPKYKHLRLTIGQASPEMLYRFNAAVGGLGRVTGPNTQGMWALSFSGFERVQAVYAMLWFKLCTPKREQIKLARTAYLAYARTVRKRLRRKYKEQA